ncbi:two-component response regulator-like PRR95 isoform X1 [Rhododendron vialii]|uniref:two-component response regulator-like PRR95 isoform X1 n=1 Tax=Rhododendron vialii TaxID=182163 RepID=UPI00265FC30D|nr:two-component response regulator-like PRR95 isoform X1 [Rhododendron vialii]
MGEGGESIGGGMKVEEEREKESSSLVLPRRFLRVLLVESDDSTRQIIAALLRKCSYRVDAVPDGLKAWETLKEGPNNIDLILTEVELPSISGYALLTLITEHDACKNIPVIMMSSQDSVSVVLKCMLKGAADFLIKPLRKNELRNLWQHVWRRQIKKWQQTKGYVPVNAVSEQEKVKVTSENSTASNHSSDSLDSTPKKDCGKKGSDAQSSCTPCLEAKSANMQNMQGLSHLKWGSSYKRFNTEEHEDRMLLDEKSLIPKTGIGRKSIGMELESASCNEPYSSTVSMDDLVCGRAMTGDADFDPESNEGHASKNIEVHFLATNMSEPSIGALDLIGKFEQHPENTYGNLSANDNTSRFSFAPDLELSLRRFHQSYPKTEATDEGHTLNHSNASAFSWYNDGKASRPLLPASPSDCSELKEAASSFYKELNHFAQNKVGIQPHGAVSDSQENNMSSLFSGQSGHSETAFVGHQLGHVPVPGVKFDSFFSGYGQIFPPIMYTQSDFPPLWNAKDQCEQSPFLMSSSAHSSSEIHNSDQCNIPYEKTTNHSTGNTVREEDNNFESVLRDGSATPGLSCISTLCDCSDGNKLESGASENKCDGCDGDAIQPASFVRTRVSEIVIDTGLGRKDSHCPSQREAALLKFRLKRKDRCYDKKVRYQSRKRLAEQRPRVKGQFVRQVQNEQSTP